MSRRVFGRARLELAFCVLLTDGRFFSGDEVSVFYDPMIAKLVVWDVDRRAALSALTYALTKYKVVGPENNVAFLLDLARHKAFVAGDVETGFIAKYRADLLPATVKPAPPSILAQAALFVLLKERAAANALARDSAGTVHCCLLFVVLLVVFAFVGFSRIVCLFVRRGFQVLAHRRLRQTPPRRAGRRRASD